jgi:hypothetical protein
LDLPKANCRTYAWELTSCPASEASRIDGLMELRAAVPRRARHHATFPAVLPAASSDRHSGPCSILLSGRSGGPATSVLICLPSPLRQPRHGRGVQVLDGTAANSVLRSLLLMINNSARGMGRPD